MPRKPKGVKFDQETIADAVKRTGNRASEYLRDREKARKLLDDARRKAGDKMPSEGPLVEVWQYLQTLFRLLGAYTRREYTEIPWKSLVLIGAAILYFVMPADLIPDIVPVAGLVDDAAVIAFVVAQVRNDLDAFAAWEASQPGTSSASGDSQT
jgi:uncharacterized membrane protein YkvA (DUF1232 family)